MPRAEPLRTDTYRTLDDVDEYIRARQDQGAGRRSRPRRGLLAEDFFWSEPSADDGPSRNAAPAAVRAVTPVATQAATPVATERRTIVITGRGAERSVSARRGYEGRLRPHERSGFKPDRVAMWAVLLCVALLLGAVTSSHAAVLHAASLHLR